VGEWGEGAGESDESVACVLPGLPASCILEKTYTEAVEMAFPRHSMKLETFTYVWIDNGVANCYDKDEFGVHSCVMGVSSIVRAKSISELAIACQKWIAKNPDEYVQCMEVKFGAAK
jgi:hypothetical protein